eukprot:TRINITY_DN896_c0_g1_i2.p2 TRINITY_DN896_c0_g1~~TRINITY_DN896_c0_g1_i2.p2  ORF type:complete len:171 (+),score=30.19 TRINITY_DN896_c0_g1_i2:1179-1691(+)
MEILKYCPSKTEANVTITATSFIFCSEGVTGECGLSGPPGCISFTNMDAAGAEDCYRGDCAAEGRAGEDCYLIFQKNGVVITDIIGNIAGQADCASLKALDDISLECATTTFGPATVVISQPVAGDFFISGGSGSDSSNSSSSTDASDSSEDGTAEDGNSSAALLSSFLF